MLFLVLLETPNGRRITRKNKAMPFFDTLLIRIRNGVPKNSKNESFNSTKHECIKKTKKIDTKCFIK